MENLDPEQFQTLLRWDLAMFTARGFAELCPGTEFSMNGHVDVMASKLTAVRNGDIRRLIINVPPRHLKSIVGSIAFPAWCLGHNPSARIMCVSYGQDLSDKHARDCRRIMTSPWYLKLFPDTRLGSAK